jgi:hypothetical protein
VWLGGGHARLLKVVFDSWVKQAPPAGNQIDYFVAQSDVQEECRRVLIGLHPQERAAAIRLAQGQSRGDDDDTLDHLRRRGLLLDIAQGKWFSPLWAEYLRTTRSLRKGDRYVGDLLMWVFGAMIVVAACDGLSICWS